MVVAVPSLDRGERSLALDLKSADGLAAVEELAAEADVFVEGFRPGVAERIGIGPDQLCALNPRLVYARMTGWGQQGQLAQTAGHDINYIALAGLLQPIARRGERPLPPSNLLGDFAGGGMLMALEILAALHERNGSGKGQVIDAAMVDGASTFTSFMRGLHAVGLWNEEPGTNALDGAAAFYDTYPCADGQYVAVGCVEPQFFLELLEKVAIDEPDLPFKLDPTGWEGLAHGDRRSASHADPRRVDRPLRGLRRLRHLGPLALGGPPAPPQHHPRILRRGRRRTPTSPGPQVSRTPATTPGPHQPGTGWADVG